MCERGFDFDNFAFALQAGDKASVEAMSERCLLWPEGHHDIGREFVGTVVYHHVKNGMYNDFDRVSVLVKGDTIHVLTKFVTVIKKSDQSSAE